MYTGSLPKLTTTHCTDKRGAVRLTNLAPDLCPKERRLGDNIPLYDVNQGTLPHINTMAEEQFRKSHDHLYRPFLDLPYCSTPSGELYLRIWPARPTAPLWSGGNKPRPWAYFMHGGAYHIGQHTLPRDWMLCAFLSRGYHFVSVQYRFSPHVALWDSVEDCGKGVDWVRENLPRVLADFRFQPGPDGEQGAPEVVLDKCIAFGDSAGGTMATNLALDAKRRPKMVFKMYALADFIPPQQMPLSIAPWDPVSSASMEEIIQESKSRDPTRAVAWCQPPTTDTAKEADELFGLRGTPWEGAVDDPKVRLQFDVHSYLINNRILHQSTLRSEECDGPDEWWERCKSMSPLHRADREYPTTMVLHAEDDWIGTHEKTREFARVVRSKGVKVREWYIPKGELDEGEHLADTLFSTGHRHWKEYVVPIMNFIDSQLLSNP